MAERKFVEFIRSKRVQTAAGLTLLSAAVLGGEACGGNSEGQTFTTGQLTQTAEAGLPQTATPEGTKIVVVEVTPTATPKPTEAPIPTPTPEVKYTPAELTVYVSGVLSTLVADPNIVAEIKDQLNVAQNTIASGDPVRVRIPVSAYTTVAKGVIKVGCANPESKAIADVFLAVKGVHYQYEQSLEAKGVYPKGTWEENIEPFTYRVSSVVANCPNKFLNPDVK